MAAGENRREERTGALGRWAGAWAVLFASAGAALAAGASGPAVPLSGLKLPDGLEIVIILAVFAGACLLWGATRAVPVVGGLVAAVVCLPLAEEVMFRFFGQYVVGRQMMHWESWRTVVYVGVFFGLAHAAIAFLNGASSLSGPFSAPPGLQVGEGLFIGMFNGLMFMVFVEVYHFGLLLTMIYVWLAHMLINAAAVGYNFVVNTLLGRSLLAHLLPRAFLALCAAYWFYRCWTEHRIDFGVFR